MTLDIQKYNRKPFLVDGVRITKENFDEAAAWCESSEIHHNERIPEKSFFKVNVKNPINDRQTLAYPGDWLLRNTNGFKVYTDYAFGHNFELVDGPDTFFIGGVQVKADDSVPEGTIHYDRNAGPTEGRVSNVSIFGPESDIQVLVDRAVAPLELKYPPR